MVHCHDTIRIVYKAEKNTKQKQNQTKQKLTRNRKLPTGGSAYGTPINARIPFPSCERRCLPTNLLPFGKLTRNSLEVLPLILLTVEHIVTKLNATKQSFILQCKLFC